MKARLAKKIVKANVFEYIRRVLKNESFDERPYWLNRWCRVCAEQPLDHRLESALKKRNEYRFPNFECAFEMKYGDPCNPHKLDMYIKYSFFIALRKRIKSDKDYILRASEVRNFVFRIYSLMEKQYSMSVIRRDFGMVSHIRLK